MTPDQHSPKWRVWHRWLSLVFGIQLLVWSVSGAYMVFFDLSFIHGNHLVKANSQPLPLKQPSEQPIASLAAVLEKYPRVRDISLQSTTHNQQEIAVYRLFGHRTTLLVNAVSLEPIEFSQNDILTLANHYYAVAPDPVIESIHYLETEAPEEISARILPVWQVNYDDFADTSLYISATTGELVSKRHDFWRGFDFMWMLHIMDYETRENITSWLLRAFIIGTTVLMFTGLVLLIFTLRRYPARPRS